MITQVNIITLLLLFATILGCKSNQLQPSASAHAGLFKVTIFYPNEENATFDFDYYEKKHMPMVAGFLGENLTAYEIDRGVSGRAASDAPLYIATGYFFVKDLDTYNNSIAAHREVIVNDFKNYTNVRPVIQINEVRAFKPVIFE